MGVRGAWGECRVKENKSKQLINLAVTLTNLSELNSPIKIQRL